MEIFSVEILMSFLTLSLLEIVLGIDNLIFIALIADNLPKEYRAKARLIGLMLALVIRIIMLCSVSWLMGLTEPLFTAFGLDISFRDLLLIAGGLFLMVKATKEMHADIARDEEHHINVRSSFRGAIIQIALVDLVFSFDSIITAVGLAPNLWVIFAAVLVSMIVMLLASGYISELLRKYPTFKILALSFILMIGMLLVAQGLHFHVPKGYVYFAFAFSMGVEVVNTIAAKKRKQREA